MKFYRRALALSCAFTLLTSPFWNKRLVRVEEAVMQPIIEETITEEIALSNRDVELEQITPINNAPAEEILEEKTIAEEETIAEELEESKRNLRDISTFEDKNVIMLTFDDGPSSSNTPHFLDELESRDARVTFFVVGYKIDKHQDIIKRAYEAGHTIGNHSFSHPEFTKISNEMISEEINNTNQLLKEVLGIDNRFFRPPYGSTNKNVFEVANQSFIMWSVDPRDWQYRCEETVYQYIMNGAAHGAIMVLHDTYPTTISGALRAIDELLLNGYALISLEEALELGYISPEENEKIYSLKK